MIELHGRRRRPQDGGGHGAPRADGRWADEHAGGALHGPGRTLQRDRFVREARAAARVIHPNIAIVHDVDPEAGWLVMELGDAVSVHK